MTTLEFSNQWDVLLSSYLKAHDITSLDGFTFDEYEKSVFLTAAQEEFVIHLYNGKNGAGESFETSEEARRYLAPLVTEKITNADSSKGNQSLFSIEDDVLFIIYESVNWTKEELGCKPYLNIPVIPVKHDEYHRIKNNPFRGANNNRVLRLDIGAENKPCVELISKYKISQYKYRYIKKPSPIVTVQLEGDLNIQGVSMVSECVLPEILHERILERAVQKALTSRNIQTTSASQ